MDPPSSGVTALAFGGARRGSCREGTGQPARRTARAAGQEASDSVKWVVDLDGVVYRGRELLPGAVRFFERTRERGQDVVVVTNNSLRSADDYLALLHGFGIGIERRQIVTSSMAAARYLARQGCRGPVLAIGERGVCSALEEAGLLVVGPDDAEGAVPAAVVVGLDRAFTYRKLEAACRAIRRGARFVGTNPDPTLPVEEGRFIPGCGSLLAAMRACSGVEPVVVGKPNPEIMEMALERLGVRPGGRATDVVVVGDRLDTDVEAARRAGLVSALVLTGVTSAAELEREGGPRPDYVFAHLDHLTRALVDGVPDPA